VHKTLHHKRPSLVPLLDNKTIRPIGEAAERVGCTKWQLIWDEIHGHSADFGRLAGQFDQHALAKGGVSLSWLRLYDILVWMAPATGRLSQGA